MLIAPDPREARRRNTDRAWYIVAWQWCLAPVVEGWCGLSLVRFLCIYFAGLVGLSVRRSPGHTITANALWLALAVIAAAFGEKVFVKFINKVSLTSNTQQQDRRSVVAAFVPNQWANGEPDAGIL